MSSIWHGFAAPPMWTDEGEWLAVAVLTVFAGTSVGLIWALLGKRVRG